MFITGAVALACPSVLSIQGNSHFVVRRCCFFGEKILHLQSRLKQGRSSAGLERFSHIEEVIGSNPIVPTKSPATISGGRTFLLSLYPEETTECTM